MKLYRGLRVWAFVATLALAPAARAQERQFALGVEYMVPGLASVYARTGVTWAKAMGTGFSWGDIEPEEPVRGKHRYRWEQTDRLILEYQRAGFRNFHVYVKCRNRWASSKPLQPIGGGSHLPRPEFLDDYRDFLRALVQRYDVKSPAHAPGLLHSVEYWEIEAEWGTGFWQDSLDDYLKLLRVAYATIKSANPSAKVILIGFFLVGLFEGHPDPREIPATLASMPSQRARTCRQYLADIRELLSHPDLFDVVEFHSLSDWSEISGMARFLRQTMRERGYEKPIWVGDVNYTASPLVFWGQPVPPYTPRQKPAIDRTLRALANPRHAQHAKVEAWFRAEQSRGLVKKVVLAMADGLAGINIGNLKDEALFSFVPGITGTAAFHGLVETHGNPPKPGKPRPAYHALKLVVDKLVQFRTVETLRLGPGVYAYRFLVNGWPVYVLWYDDGKRYLPGDPEPTRTVELRLPAGSYLLTEAPTRSNGTPPRTVSAAQGVLRLRLNTTPVFMEPLRQPGGVR